MRLPSEQRASEGAHRRRRDNELELEDVVSSSSSISLPPSLHVAATMNYLAPLITGRYDLSFLPLSLPTPLVLALLSPSLSSLSSPFLTATSLSALGLSVPSPGPGRSWIVLEAGQQIGTGVAIPGGRSHFAVRLSLAQGRGRS